MDDPCVLMLETIAKAIVDNQEAVRVTRTIDQRGVLLSLAVSGSDMGKVIGRDGALAQGIRLLLRAAGAKHGQSVSVKIIEPTLGQQTMRGAFQDAKLV